MLRPDDFDSNSVARFAVENNVVQIKFDGSDGIAPKEVYMASQWNPGSSIYKIYLSYSTNNLGAADAKVNLHALSGSNAPFISYTVSPNTSSQILTEELNFGPNQLLFVSIDSVLNAIENESISLTIFARDF